MRGSRWTDYPRRCRIPVRSQSKWSNSHRYTDMRFMRWRHISLCKLAGKTGIVRLISQLTLPSPVTHMHITFGWNSKTTDNKFNWWDLLDFRWLAVYTEPYTSALVWFPFTKKNFYQSDFQITYDGHNFSFCYNIKSRNFLLLFGWTGVHIRREYFVKVKWKFNFICYC